MAQALREIDILECCILTKMEYNQIVAKRQAAQLSMKGWFTKDFVNTTFEK